MLVSETTSGVTAPVWEARLKILATPGSTTPTDLVSYDYVEAALSEQDLTDSQRDFIPYLITAASKAAIKWCNRNFFQAVYVEDLQPALDGFVRLKNIPINQVVRIQALPQEALSVSNIDCRKSPSVTSTHYTGDISTGLDHNRGSTPHLRQWRANHPDCHLQWQRDDQQCRHRNRVARQWLAAVPQLWDMYAWPVTELIGGWVSQDATISQGVILNVYSQGVSQAQLDPDDGNLTGMLWVGRQNNDGIRPAMGA